MDSNPRDVLAAKHFPREWAAIANKPGASKKRQQLRQRGEAAEVCAGLRAQGARCANCDSYDDAPKGLRFRHHCAAKSDWEGYVEALADDLCPRWNQRR